MSAEWVTALSALATLIVITASAVADPETRRRLVAVFENRRHHLNNPASYDNFEYLAAIATRFKERHPAGTYPDGFPRMPLPPLWELW